MIQILWLQKLERRDGNDKKREDVKNVKWVESGKDTFF